MFADYRLANSIADLFRHIPPDAITNLYEQVREAAKLRGMDYEEEDGGLRIINLFLRPRLIDEAQRDYFYKVCMQMNSAFDKLFVLRNQRPELRDILPLPAEEQKWFDLVNTNRDIPLTNFSRWDANADFSGLNWKGQFHFFEVNGVGVGGIHYSPVVESIVYDIVLPQLQKVDPDLVLEKNDDARDLLLGQLAVLAKAIGRSKPHLGFLVDMRCVGGPNEFPKLAQYAKNKGFEAVCCDPRDLYLKKGEIYHQNFRIDLLYRDTTLSEFIEMERDGEDLDALRGGFTNHQIVSSLGGELDHKSCFEIFSSPQYHRWFTPAQRRFFKRHVLWTRLMQETYTSDHKENKVDLVKYVRLRQNRLMLKPNRGFGGEGILVGEKTTRKDWHKAIQRALTEKGEWVVQRKVNVHSKKFPLLSDSGKLREDKLNVVCGFIATPLGLAILGRASRGQIVNVARGGGMTAILSCMNR